MRFERKVKSKLTTIKQITDGTRIILLYKKDILNISQYIF